MSLLCRSRKGHSFLHEYPRIRVDRFTESRERIPAYLKRPNARVQGDGSNSELQYADAPWQDLELAGTDDCFPHPTIQLLTHIVSGPAVPAAAQSWLDWKLTCTLSPLFS